MPTIAKRKPSHLAPDGLPYHGLVRLPQILTVIPVSRATLYNWIKSGKLPQPVKIGPRCVAWPVEVVRALLGAPVATEMDPNVVAAVAARKAKQASEAEKAARRAQLL